MTDMPKLVAFDLDGTLAESKSPVTPEMGTLLGGLLGKVPVAVMSGGAWHQFEKQLLPALAPETHVEKLYLFPVSAARCYEFKDGAWTILYTHDFTPEERAAVLKALDESLAETGFAEPPAQTWGPRIEDRGAQISFSALGQEAPIEAKRNWDPDKSKRTPIRDALVKRLPGFSIRMNATNTIDITKEGLTKAYGVRQLSEITRIPISDMVYVGDALGPGGNDEIVKETGIPTQAVSGPTETAAFISELLAGRA